MLMITKSFFLKELEDKFNYGRAYYILPYGSPEDFYIKSNYHGYNLFDEIPSKQIVDNIKSLSVILDETEICNKLPNWIYKAKNLIELSIPICFLEDSDFLNSKIFKQLKSLTINRLIGLADPDIELNCQYLSNLEKLIIHSPKCSLLETGGLKKLRFFKYNMELATSDTLNDIDFLPYIDYLILDQISNKASLDKITKAQLIGFDITNNCSKDHILKKLNKDKLKYLRINKYNQEVDILDFINSPMLQELTIISSKIINTEEVLNITSLNSLEILDSKSKITESLRYKLNTINLDRISIEYS